MRLCQTFGWVCLGHHMHIEGSGVAVFCVGQHKQFPDHCQVQFVTEILWPKNNDVCVFRGINIAKTSNGGGGRRQQLAS